MTLKARPAERRLDNKTKWLAVRNQRRMQANDMLVEAGEYHMWRILTHLMVDLLDNEQRPVKSREVEQLQLCRAPT